MGENVVSLLPFVLISVITLVPAIAILRRMGKSWGWAAFVLIPWLGTIIFLYILAFSLWPNERQPQSPP